MREPRPIICLNSVMELMRLSNTTSLTVRVYAGAQELGGCGDDGIAALGVDEVVQFGFALCFIARDAHDVFAVLCGEVPILIDQRLAHSLRVIYVFAEHDGFSGIGRSL